MSRLGRENKVLFASLPPNILEARTLLCAQRGKTKASILVSDRLREYVHTPWLPVNYRSSGIESLVENLRRWRLRREMTRLQMSDPILYIWHPCFVDAIGSFRERLVVFHCYDECSAFCNTDEERELVKSQEERLARRADLIIAASESLAAGRRPYNPNVHVVENGVDFDLFAQAQDPRIKVPAPLAELKGPVIGCVLTQLTVVDIPMLSEVMRLRPGWQVAIIGMDRPEGHLQSSELRNLLARPNLHFLGRQRQSEMPAFLKGCDVCTIPWVINDITAASSSPLKLFEYFAAGKPIVSARLPLLAHLSDMVAFADGPEQWVCAIERCLASDGPALVAKRQELARRNTWDQRVASIEASISKAIAAKARSRTGSH